MGQFFALYRKNFIYWYKNWCGSICEVVAPIIFALFLVAIGGLSDDKKLAQTSYLNEPIWQTPNVTAPTTFPANYGAWATAAALNNVTIIKNCKQNAQFETRPVRRGGKVALGPKGNPAALRVEAVMAVAGIKSLWYDSLQELNDWTRSFDYARSDGAGAWDQICFGVFFDEYNAVDKKFAYRMLWNMTGPPQRDDAPDKGDEALIEPFTVESDQMESYVENGFGVIQQIIDNTILQSSTGQSAAKIDAAIVKKPRWSYEKSTIYENTRGSVGIIIFIPTLFFYLRMIYAMLQEKEKRITANLRNMGMNMFTHYMSWFTFYMTLHIILSIIWALIAKGFFKESDYGLVFWLYFMLGFFQISMAMFVQAFFVSAKPGVLAGIIVFFILEGVNIGMLQAGDASSGTLVGFSFSPFAGVELASKCMVIVESSKLAFGYNLFWTTIQKYKYGYYFLITFFEAIFFVFAGMYVDMIWPSDIGVNKHPLFCFGFPLKKKAPRNVKQDEEGKELMEQNKWIMEKTAADLNEPLDRKIVLDKLEKKYPNGKCAVQGLSLEMYMGEIYALLGHNGAGKTSTISMLTGLLSITGGKCTVLGHDVAKDKDVIKSLMGICPQTNPIYDKLSVKQHLELYAKIKNPKQPKAELESEIKDLLTDIDLLHKVNYRAGGLSGGQKRKLCVAMAFVGDSKVIVLDEPTSGMDTQARRQLWNMIKTQQEKKERLILLTTHFMDEAETLGNRIGIMGEGKLITEGTALHLKKTHGAGYILSIVKEEQSDESKIVDCVTGIISEAKKNDIGKGKEVQFRLPQEQDEHFEELFTQLETQKQELGIANFGISLTTLEDVFIKVAEGKFTIEEKQKQKQLQVELQQKIDQMGLKKLEDIRIKSVFWTHFWALTVKRFLYFKRDVKGLICEVILPTAVVVLGLCITLVSFVTNSPEFNMTISDSMDNRVVNVPINNNNPALTANILNQLNVNQNIVVQSAPYASLAAFDNFLVTDKDENKLFGVYLDTVDNINFNYKYYLFANSTAFYSPFVGMNQVNQAILRTATNNNNAYINVRIDPLLLTQQFSAFENTADGFMAVFLIALAFAFIPSSVVVFIVKERENNVKHQQLVSGVSIYAYWLSNLFIDYVKYLIPAIFTALSIVWFDVEAFRKDDNYGGVWALLLLYGPVMITFTYLKAFMFKSPSAAQVFVFLVNFLTGFLLMFVSFILRLIESTRNPQRDEVDYLFRFFPSFDFAFGLFSMANDTLWWTIFKLDKVPKAWTKDGMLIEFIYLIVFFFVFSVLILVIEYVRDIPNTKTQQVMNALEQEQQNQVKGEDEDVLAEREFVKNNQTGLAIRVNELVKAYILGGGCGGKNTGFKTAVKRISFGVEPGDCFGLLGTNGAGKTSTFKVLSGEVKPTSGTAHILGLDVVKQQNKIRHNIGYCPQFDALLDNLTAREHLALYSAIKGIPKAMRENYINAMLDQLQLRKYEHVQAGTYSGGNKRKLSVALALLGNPPILLLDEPSSGMDPMARRFMWGVISKVSRETKQSSVVLTTHSMEEAEFLSTKLSIMVEGNIKCVGPIQALKNKYGQGFEIELQIDDSNKDYIQQMAKQCWQGSPNLAQIQIFQHQLQQIMNAIQAADLFEEISGGSDKKGNVLYRQLTRIGHLKPEALFEWVSIQRQAAKVQNYLDEKFGKVTRIENYQSFFRFKTSANVQLSALFGNLKKAQAELKISQYAIRQTSIEQIFISLAENVQHDD